jgi:hypothetical protein
MNVKLRTMTAGAALGSVLALLGLPAQAHHNDWAAPLVGGALGGYALSSIVGAEQQKAKAASSPSYVAPPPTTYYAPVREYVPVSSTASIETRLKQLDQLAAGGYITKEEYQQRRAAILNGL